MDFPRTSEEKNSDLFWRRNKSELHCQCMKFFLQFLGSGGAFQWSSCIFTGLQYTVSEVTDYFCVKPCVIHQRMSDSSMKQFFSQHKVADAQNSRSVLLCCFKLCFFQHARAPGWALLVCMVCPFSSAPELTCTCNWFFSYYTQPFCSALKAVSLVPLGWHIEEP